MRIKITVHIENQTPIPVQMPDDVPVQKLLPALVKKLNLPEGNDLQAHYNFDFLHLESGKKIVDRKTLAQAGIRDQAHLKLLITKVQDVIPLSPQITAHDLWQLFLYRLQTFWVDKKSRAETLSLLVWVLVAVVGLVNLYVLLHSRDVPGGPGTAQTPISETSPALNTGHVTPVTKQFSPAPLVLDYTALDAEYNRATDRLVMISKRPPALHIYEPASGEEAMVSLSLDPLAVAVSPNGQFAAVGHDKLISYVDLAQQQVIKEVPLTVTVFDIVLRDDGWMYVGTEFIRGKQEAMLWAVHVDSGKELAMLGTWLQWSALYRLHPEQQSLYTANYGMSPDAVARIKLIDGIAMFEYEYPYHSEHQACGNLWLSESGDRVFTACGNVFRVDANSNEDLIYDGRLGGTGLIKSLAHSAAANRILTLSFYNRCATQDNLYRITDPQPVLRIFEGTDLNFLEQITLASYQNKPVTPCFVFVNQPGDEFYVLVNLPVTGHSGLIISQLNNS